LEGTIAAMMLANLTWDPTKWRQINLIVPTFQDYLPPLQRDCRCG